MTATTIIHRRVVILGAQDANWANKKASMHPPRAEEKSSDEPLLKTPNRRVECERRFRAVDRVQAGHDRGGEHFREYSRDSADQPHYGCAYPGRE